MRYIRYTMFVFLLAFMWNTFAQDNHEAGLNKLSRDLLELVQSHKTNALSKAGAQSARPSGTSDSGEEVYSVIITGENLNEVRSLGINVNSEVNDFVTARVTVDDLFKLIELNSVKRIETGEILYPHNDLAGALTGADLLHSGYLNNTIYKGEDVLVCIIDSGIDWDHPDFRDSADQSQSRILYLWDQTLTVSAGEQTPEDRDGSNFSGLNYGVEYTQAHINDELDGSPAGFVRETDSNGHGTHVAGTAAGNGSALSGGKYTGIAPKADLIVIKAGNGTFSTANVIDAVTYAGKISDELGKPIVVNMSLGGHRNAHDGTSSQAQAVDNFVGPGRIAVISAGNSGASAIHITGTVGAGSSTDITFTVPSYTPASGTNNDYFLFDLWFDTNGDVTAQMTSPNASDLIMPAGSQGSVDVADGNIFILNEINAANSDRHIEAEIFDFTETNTPEPGTWTLTVTNNSAGLMTYHGWLYNTTIGAALTGGNSEYTIGSPGTATEAITVGSFVSRWRWHATDDLNYNYNGTDGSDNISSFSSIGPRRDGAQKPDITAPGQAIVSATSSNSSPASSAVIVNGAYHMNQGTSMSAPVVAGAVALLLEQNSSLTASQVKTYLTDNADVDSYSGVVPNTTWGYGRLNIFASMADLVNPSWIASKEVLAYDEWTTTSGIGIGPGVGIAVKFTPTFTGKITGLLFHLSGANNITGSLSAEIWSDNGLGFPDANVGSTVLLPSEDISGNSWNYINMQPANVNITGGTDYHAVLYYATGASTAFLFDSGNINPSSSINNGSGWTQSTSFGVGDFRIRPVITTSDALLPVELFAFIAMPTSAGVKLEWSTATELNSYGFEIERTPLRSSNYSAASWEMVGFIEGAGNSNSLKEYSFIDDAPLEGKTLYRLKQIDMDGSFTYSEAVEASFMKPYEYALEQNYPNPFNPTTNFGFRIPNSGLVTLKLYDILGTEVATLVNEKKEPGFYEVKFDGSNLASGVYLYKLTAQEAGGGTAFSASKKFVLLR